jgi:hypothetical protein
LQEFREYRRLNPSLVFGGRVAVQQQGGAPVKLILACVAFATLTASPLFAQSQANERPPYPRTYPEQKKQLRANHRDLDARAQAPDYSTFNPSPMNQGLCSTAPGFCSDYHGSNGG